MQFAVNPETGALIVIEMNPRVSRSSALASKATGFPIAKIAAKLAVGYTLDEIKNDITRETPASFEPTIDYVVTKIPRFTFEKFPDADSELTTQMKSVGEVMAIGRTFKESFQKAIRSLEIGHAGFEPPEIPEGEAGLAALVGADRPAAGRAALGDRRGVPPRGDGRGAVRAHEDRSAGSCAISRRSSQAEGRARGAAEGRARGLAAAGQAARLLGSAARRALGRVRGDGARAAPRSTAFDRSTSASTPARPSSTANTPYLYSTYEEECEAEPTDRKKIMILGGGPNRIGQGIEFDYCCVHAVFALRDAGFETIMVNCNPETVSTDYDTSDRLYFEPLTLEDVLEIVERREAAGAWSCSSAGRRRCKLAVALEQAGVPIIGTPPDAIDLRRGPRALRGAARAARSRAAGGRRRAQRRGGRADRGADRLSGAGAAVLRARRARDGDRARRRGAAATTCASRCARREEHPVLVDRFLADAIEVDVDAICDGERVVVGGIMEHIEEAGIHSGDSACSLPPYSLAAECIERDHGRDAQARARDRRARPDERAVRREGRTGLRDRGESARVAHGALRVEGDRRSAREARGARDGGALARRRSDSRRRSCRGTSR